MTRLLTKNIKLLIAAVILAAASLATTIPIISAASNGCSQHQEQYNGRTVYVADQGSCQGECSFTNGREWNSRSYSNRQVQCRLTDDGGQSPGGPSTYGAERPWWESNLGNSPGSSWSYPSSYSGDLSSNYSGNYRYSPPSVPRVELILGIR